MKKNFWQAVLLLIVLCVAFPACAYGENARPLRIVCTSFPCYDFARAVAGGEEIQLLIKPGAEVHSYEPTPAEVLSIAQCDLFVYIGGESDAWVRSILESFGSDAPQTLRFFDCVEAIEEEEQEEMTFAGGHDHDEDGAEYDEHIWTSPVNAAAMVGALRDALCEICPERSDAYSVNAEAYIGEIMEIDSAFREVVDGAARRELIFADRFPFLYFVREYGLSYSAAFPYCAAESEPSAKTLAYLIERVREDGIPAIYTIELSSGRTAQAISEETGAEILTMQSVQNVSEADFSAGESYISLMRRNLEALREGLN